MERALRDEFHRKIENEWKSLWTERFDDKNRAEGASVRDYPLLLTDRGCVIFSNRDVKTKPFCVKSETRRTTRVKGSLLS